MDESRLLVISLPYSFLARGGLKAAQSISTNHRHLDFLSMANGGHCTGGGPLLPLVGTSQHT